MSEDHIRALSHPGVPLSLPDFAADVEERKRKDRPGDQPLPVPNDGPSMHDLVCEDLRQSGIAGSREDSVIADLQARKRLGLARYGTVLQAHNDRDALRDLYEELQDAAVYARQVLEEQGDQPGVRFLSESVTFLLVRVRRMRDEH